MQASSAAKRTRAGRSLRARPRKLRPLPTDPLGTARVAGLRYVSDSTAGIERRRAGKGFVYKDRQGAKVKDVTTLQRIRRLAIPPAWTRVWVCPSTDGHLQATGRDAKGRKQYRYHPDWMDLRNQTKYERLLRFGTAMVELRKRTHEDLGRRGLPREKVLATVAGLLQRTFMRVGNVEYTKQNQSYGLTTLRDQHVDVVGSTLRFEFRGKSGVSHSIEVSDPRLARVVARCKDIPGYELFQYLDEDGGRTVVDSGDVNGYLREIMGEDFTAKDFRTWAGTVQAAVVLRDLGPCATAKEAKSKVVDAIKEVARRLGNKPSTTRKYYVHPAIVEAYVEGRLLAELARCSAQDVRARCPDLICEEIAVLSILEQAARKPAPLDLEAALAKSLEARP